MPPEEKSRFLPALLVIAVVLVALMLWTFAGALFAAAVIASALLPLQQRLTARFAKRRYVAAGVLSLGVVLVVVIPLVVTSVFVVREGTRAVSWALQTLREDGVAGLVAPLPDALEPYAIKLVGKLPFEALPAPAGNARSAPPVGVPLAPLVESASDAAEPDWALAANTLRELVVRFSQILIATGIFVLATFFLLADGERLVDYLVDLAPLDETRGRALLGEFRSVSVGVLISVLSTAVAQTAAAALGYWIAGTPSMALALLATFVCSFIPAIGGAGVTMTIGALLLASGRPGMGIFLIVWGLLVVGLIDNLVKPWVAKDHAHLPASIVFFAMICGLALFGPLGLIAGPLIVAFFHVVAGFWRAEQGRGPAPNQRARRTQPTSARN